MTDEKNVISEKMVELIFSPIKDRLEKSTVSIDEAVIQVRDLVRILTSSPTRADIIEKISLLIKEHEQLTTQRHKEMNECVEDEFEKHEQASSEKFVSAIGVVNELEATLGKTGEQIKSLSDVTNNLTASLTSAVHSLTNKINFLLAVIGITFTLSLLAWGVVAWVFNKYGIATPPTP